MTPSVRIGVVGAGAIAQVAHLPSLARIRGAELVALCDNDRPKARALAERFGAPDVVTDIEDLLALPDIDAVIVCTPNHLHEPHVLAALASGVHVLCERPLALDTRGVERILAAAKRADRKVAVGNNHRFRADVQALGAFLRGFWISPREHPDFAWAFFGRFSIYMGYQAILTYLLYILEDYIGLGQAVANTTIARMSSVTFVALVCSGLLAGWLADRTGRLKPLVFVAGLLIACAEIAPLVSPNLRGMFGYAVLIGLGYGSFMSVDLALMTHVLPPRAAGEDTTGRDLGILTTAINVPQILSPVMAAALLSATGNNYPLLFCVAAIFVVAGAGFVLPIRSVR